MNSKTLTLALLAAFAGTASAQSSVTAYGILSLAVSKTNNGQSTLTFVPGTFIGRNTYNMSPATSSRLGFRGTEDLGGGLRANFNFEHRFLPDTGAVEPRDGALAGGFWNSFAYVGVSGPFGEVRLGRQFVPAFFIALQSDPWAYDVTAGGASGFTRGGNAVTMSYNAVSYRSPRIGGFSTELMVGAGEGGSAAVNAPAGRSGRNVGANVQYTAGPLWAGIGFNNAQQVGTPTDNRYWNVGVAYDFKFIRPMAAYSVGNNNVAGNPDTKTYLIGATAPVGAGRAKMVAARYDAAVGQNFNANNTLLPAMVGGQNTTKFGLGYEYSFSKRTSIHADVGTAKTQSVSRTNGFDVGIKHVF